MTLVLSTREVSLVARISRALLSLQRDALPAWWAETSAALLELFAGDHAMCALPTHTGLLARQIDDSALAGIAEVSTQPAVRRIDPLYVEVNSACDRNPRLVWNRVGTLRDTAVARKRSSPMYDAFRDGDIAESANIDLTISGRRAALCVSFDRNGSRVERARALAELLAPSFEAGVRALAAKQLAPDAAALLTPRERELALLLLERRTNREIAETLGISEHTVRHHLESIFGKLGVRSRRAAIARLTV